MCACGFTVKAAEARRVPGRNPAGRDPAVNEAAPDRDLTFIRVGEPTMVRTHQPAWTCYPSWLADFLTDPRVFHNAARTLRAATGRQRQSAGFTGATNDFHQRSCISLSFDIERDYDAPFESSESRTAGPFLREFSMQAAGLPLRGTFFVQGEMVPALAEPLQALTADGHEIGLHGFRHELWGRRNWKVRRPPVVRAVREQRLIMSLENFARAGLPRPTAFRAPNFTMDDSSYALLEQLGFAVDSSVPSQRGNHLLPSRRGRVRVVPVSCAPTPVPYIHPRLGIRTAVHFSQFNYDVYMKQHEAHLANLTNDTLRFQAAWGTLPYVLMYAHNWEFHANGLQASVAQLLERTHRLSRAYDLRPVTISQLAMGLSSREVSDG